MTVNWATTPPQNNFLVSIKNYKKASTHHNKRLPGFFKFLEAVMPEKALLPWQKIMNLCQEQWDTERECPG